MQALWFGGAVYVSGIRAAGGVLLQPSPLVPGRVGADRGGP
jgi:hypothetical protein